MKAVGSKLLLLFLSALLALGACSRPRSTLEDVLHEGELVVVTRNAGSTYYEGPDGPTGLEYELARGFAEELGVKLKLVVAGTVSEVLEVLAEGDAHFAAAGLTVTDEREVWARFTPPYQQITEQLVYRLGTAKPESIDELDGNLEVVANSSHAERLRTLKLEHPDLSWSENEEVESEELLALVWEGVVDYTVIDSHEFKLNQHYYPELRVAFDLSPPQALAWAFPKFQDDSLFQKASDYFARLKENGRLAQLVERHYGHLEEFDYVGTQIYRNHVQQRLPTYRPLFEYSAEEFSLDWRLLAAMAYQESHWDPKAVSPTGVRGIMMLTQTTAKHLGVTKRTDPAQSIRGGAMYFADLLERLPERIQEPDRTWLALAAYNVGFGHLEDARIITEQRGGNPDLWLDVKQNLPLLRKKAWYKKTKRGYARGNEAVVYVENIRSYYDILVWLTDREAPAPQAPSRALNLSNPVL